MLEEHTSSWLAWLSPFGWAEQTRPFDEDALWPLGLGLAFGIGSAVVAVAPQSVRDMGAGFIAGRSGRADARAALASPHALVWRLVAPAIVGWAIAGAVTGILATTLGSVVDQIGSENPAVVEVLLQLAGDGTLDEVTVGVFFTLPGILAACAAVQTVACACQEEAHGTAELVLSTPTGRVRWLADYLVVATCAIAIVAAAAMLAGWIGIAANDGGSSLYRVVAVDGRGRRSRHPSSRC